MRQLLRLNGKGRLQAQIAAEQNSREIDRYGAVIKQQIERKLAETRPRIHGRTLVCGAGSG